MNEMELCLLHLLGFRVQVTAEQLVELVQSLDAPTPSTPSGADRASQHAATGRDAGSEDDAVTLQLPCGMDTDRCDPATQADVTTPLQTA